MTPLSNNHPLDTIELAWALDRRSAHYPLAKIASMSGRTAEEWQVALDDRQAAFAPNEVIAERFDLVRQALRAGLSIEAMAELVRAPRAWCVAAGKHVMERPA